MFQPLTVRYTGGMQQLEVNPVQSVPAVVNPLWQKLGKFLVSGGTSAVVNLGLLHALITIAGLRGGFQEDLANFIALELSVLFQFTLCRGWVWRNTPRANTPLWKELLAFHGAIALTSGGRLILFSVLRQMGVHYLPNAVLGIGCAAVANFFLYDRIVFRAKSSPEQ